MHTWPAAAPTLHRLRVHTRAPAGQVGGQMGGQMGGQVDGLALRRHWQQALDQASWAPPGLPPGAVLLVRHLALAPAAGRGSAGSLGSAAAQGGRGGPAGACTGPAVARQISQLLARRAQEARRPARDADAAQAQAVVFDDAAELAACLVHDWLQGQVAARWWWRTVLAGQGPQAWLQQQVLARGDRLVPVAARLLAETGGRASAGSSLVRWLARLEGQQALSAQRAVAASHALVVPLHSPAPGLGSQAPGPDGGANTGQAPSGAQAPSPPQLPSSGLQRLWQLAPEPRDTALARDACGLLAQLLVLQRAPGWARTEGFGDALLQLARHGPAGTGLPTDKGGARPGPWAPQTGASPPPAPMVQPGSAQARGTPAHPTPPPPAPPPQTAGGGRAPRATGHRLAPAGLAPCGAGPAHPPAPGERGAGAPRDSAARTRAVPCTPAHDAAQPGPHAAARPAAATRTNGLVAPEPGRPVDTAYGGLLYLLNAALAMGLYGDFCAPRQRGLALSPWDWLALVGQAWWGRALKQDPLWPLLAQLAGRPPGQQPGLDFIPPEDTVPTPEDLAPWGPVPVLRLQAGRARLRLWHPAGFVLLDLPRAAGQSAQVQARQWLASAAAPDVVRQAAVVGNSARQRAGTPSQPGLPQPSQPPRLSILPNRWEPSQPAHGLPLPHPPRVPRAPQARWLACHLLHLQARLALALGLEADGTQPPAPLATLLCRHPARITASASDVDVHLSLADLPLAVRCAGLDRDAGWIPAAGRSLRFHFH